MSETTSELPAVTLAREAAARGDWQAAYDLLAGADKIGALEGPHLGFLAEVAYVAGHVDMTIDAWERAHTDALRAGDRLSAAGAAVRVALHLLFDAALMAPIRGWALRAERLLEGQDATPVHAWLAVVHAYERLLSGDVESASTWARRAIGAGDPAAAAIGRVAYARSVILTGQVTSGLALLDEAAVAAVSGELDPLSTGIVYCEVVCALQAIAQYDRAEEWTEAMERWRPGQPVGSIHGRCRVHRAEILRLRGACVEAEQEALRACEELRPYLRREFGWPLTELGRIRLRVGDIEGAEHAFVAARESGWDPQPGLALVRLAQGDIAAAVSMVRAALASPSTVPSKELPPRTELRRAPLLEAQVEIELAAGDLNRAQSAADELVGIAAAFESRALAAVAALAAAQVQLASGDAAAARRRFEAAAHQWSEIGAPYEAALARMGLAAACREEGDVARAEAEFHAARVAFERVGAAHLAAAAARAMGEPHPGDNSTPPRTRSPGPARTRRHAEPSFHPDGDYWAVMFEGRTARVRDARGHHYLAHLLAHPGREFHVLDLVGLGRIASPGAIAAVPARAAGDAGELIDARAKQAYRRRLAEIEADLEEARTLDDPARAAQAEAEREFLAGELSRAIGLSGRHRRAGSAAERARVSVTRAIRHCIVRIGRHHRALADHLGSAIRTGTYCVYLPDGQAPARSRR